MYRIFCESYQNFINSFDKDNYRLKMAEECIKSISFIFDVTKIANPISYAVFYSMQYIFWQVVVAGGILKKRITNKY